MTDPSPAAKQQDAPPQATGASGAPDDARPSILGCAIMQVLSRRPASGYDLKAEFQSSIGHGWHAYDTQIYRELRRLEANGHITGVAASGRAGPQRRIYSMTESGTRALSEWLASPIDAVRHKDEVGLRIWTAEYFPPGELVDYLNDILAQWTEALAHQLMSLQALRSTPESVTRADVRSRCLAIEYTVAVTQARINWARQTLVALEAQPLESAATPDQPE